jgi:hypothetical protein
LLVTRATIHSFSTPNWTHYLISQRDSDHNRPYDTIDEAYDGDLQVLLLQQLATPPVTDPTGRQSPTPTFEWPDRGTVDLPAEQQHFDDDNGDGYDADDDETDTVQTGCDSRHKDVDASEPTPVSTSQPDDSQ